MQTHKSKIRSAHMEATVGQASLPGSGRASLPGCVAGIPACPPAVLQTCSSLVVLAAIALTFAACSREPHKRNPQSDLEPITVTTAPVIQSDALHFEPVIGTVESKLVASIEPKIQGRIIEMPVHVGQCVTQHARLAVIDAREMQAGAEKAKAAFHQAELEWKRAEQLFEQKAITHADFDSAESRLQMAAAALTEAETFQRYAEITAPFSGVITSKPAEIGDFAAPGKVLLVLQSTDGFHLRAHIPESLMREVKTGRTFVVSLDEARNRAPLKATVSEIAPAADPRTRTIPVKFDLPPDPQLLAGQFARVAIPAGIATRLEIPTSAVVRRGQLELVFVATNGHSEMRLVKTGKQSGSNIEVLAGLSAGESVITGNADRMTDRQPIRQHE